MPASRRILATAVAAAVVLASAAPAGAATIVTQPCVVSLDSSVANMPVAATGFTPGANVTVRYASTTTPTSIDLASATADAAGDVTVAATPPPFTSLGTQEQTFTLTATEDDDAALTATTTFRQVRLGYVTAPARGKPTRIATHTVRGFPIGAKTYLHFRWHGQTKRTVLLGVTSGPCGKVSRRLPLLPTRSHPGTWTVYVDQVALYSKTTQQQLKYTFVISRTSGA